tara:strand:+ start:292 stop:399 length:108 start_codon:yes stop_codon:yes gene_type:complete
LVSNFFFFVLVLFDVSEQKKQKVKEKNEKHEETKS